MEFLRGPQKAEPIVRTREGHTGPNPFLDNGWLEESYQSGDTMSVIASGGWEERQKTTKQREPQFDEEGNPIMHTVLVGDAATAVSLIRRAADYLGIGVKIDAVPATNERGRELKNQVEVKYLGKERKVRKDSEE